MWKVILRVRVEPVAEMYYGSEIETAMRVWNAISGRRVFVKTSTMPDITVLVAEMKDNNAGSTGCWVSEETGEVREALVELDAQIFPGGATRVVVHEFGHLLGLAHDEQDKGSVMYPTAYPDKWVIRAEDMRYVREKYGPH